jgi:uncharacterized protein (TIGR04255 family)
MPPKISSYETFKNAPIREAVLNISYQKLPHDYVERFEKIQSKLHADFSEMRPIEAHQKSIAFGNSQEVIPPDTSWKHGYQIWNANKAELYTARLDGFSYNKLKPYKDGKTALKKMLEGWKILKSIAPECQITSMSVRNINVIEIPEARFEIEDYFKVYPHLPTSLEKYDVSNLYLKTVLNMKHAKTMGTITLAGMPNNEKGQAQILLDIETTRVCDNKSNMKEDFISLNFLKDEIFFSAITTKCKRLFR